MRKLLLVASAMLVTGAVALAQGGVEQTLMDLERQWSKVGLAGDGKALEPLLAPDFVSTQGDGTIQSRAVFIANTNKGKWQVNEVSEMKVQVHGDAAVVTGVWTGKGTDGTGKAIDSRERFTDTWVKMPNGQWQCIASAGTAIK